jgi:hypothetical protein
MVVEVDLAAEDFTPQGDSKVAEATMRTAVEDFMAEGDSRVAEATPRTVARITTVVIAAAGITVVIAAAGITVVIAAAGITVVIAAAGITVVIAAAGITVVIVAAGIMAGGDITAGAVDIGAIRATVMAGVSDLDSGGRIGGDTHMRTDTTLGGAQRIRTITLTTTHPHQIPAHNPSTTRRILRDLPWPYDLRTTRPVMVRVTNRVLPLFQLTG